MVVPHFVDKVAVDTDREHFYAEVLELLILVGDRRYLGGSDEGEITGVEAE